MTALAAYHRTQSRIAARVSGASHENHARADRLADQTAAASGRAWKAMWQAIHDAHTYADRLRAAHEGLRAILGAGAATIHSGLRSLADHAHRSGVNALVETVPAESLALAVAVRPRRRRLLEDEGHPDETEAERAARILRDLGNQFFGQVRITPKGVELARPETVQQWRELLFPAPTRPEVEAAIFKPTKGVAWPDRLLALSRKVSPDAAATKIAVGISEGKTLQQLAKDLEPAVQGYRAGAMRIARTEGLRVAQSMQTRCHEQLGPLLAGYQIRATLDLVTRPKHAARHGRVWLKASGQSMREALVMDDDTLPDGPNCLLPGAMVQGRIVAALRAWYSGATVELVTAAGNRLTVTANHPVLTDHGFVAAHAISKGGRVLRCLPGFKAESSDHQQGRPARVEDVFKTFREVGALRHFPASPGQLHRDGTNCHGYVEVVRPDIQLLLARIAEQPELLRQRGLGWGGVQESLIASPRSDKFYFKGVGRAAASSVGGCDLLHPPPTIESAPLQFFGLGPAAQFDARLQKAAGEHNASDASFVADLLERYSSAVTLDEVVEIRYGYFRGHVYDLQTVGGWSVASSDNSAQRKCSGIMISNCRCILVPVMTPPPELTDEMRAVLEAVTPDTRTYSDWFDRQPMDVKRAAVGVKRWDAVKETLGQRKVQWADFIDPATQDLIGPEPLKSENLVGLLQRRAAVQSQQRQQASDLGQVRTYGFLAV